MTRGCVKTKLELEYICLKTEETQRKCPALYPALDLYIGTDLGCVFSGHDPIVVDPICHLQLFSVQNRKDGSALIYKRSLCIARIYGIKLHVNYGLSWTSDAVTDVLPFAGDGLKFTFDLPLPGKRVSRKSPNPRKVRTETILVNIRVTFSCQRVWQHDLFCNCKRNSRFRQFWCVQIEVIHDYQESRSCVSYGLEGEDSPDLLKR